MHLTITELEQFLRRKYRSFDNILHIGDGWHSQAFSFIAGERELVIRFSRHLRDFKKDAHAGAHYRIPGVYIPAVNDIGPYNKELSYCITDFVAGTPSDQVMESSGDAQNLQLAQNLLGPLYAIHDYDISAIPGWGYLDEQGHGAWNSWPQFLLSVYNSKEPVSWQELVGTTCLDGDFFTKMLGEMEQLFPFLPQRKQLLHGDYGFDNVLLDGNGRVTAVLDWAESMAGDALYDLVHMNEPWRPPGEETQFLPIWLQQIGHQPYLEERLRCYRIHYTLLHLHIHAVRNQEDDYFLIEDWAKVNL